MASAASVSASGALLRPQRYTPNHDSAGPATPQPRHEGRPSTARHQRQDAPLSHHRSATTEHTSPPSTSTTRSETGAVFAAIPHTSHPRSTMVTRYPPAPHASRLARPPATDASALRPNRPLASAKGARIADEDSRARPISSRRARRYGYACAGLLPRI
ncbi:hypothetical protein C8R44DRAFT_879611 [Mycena epipterygia]|nr:hypothetical protein C8R44DRAFT_879611 [Mycena epipterygia]